MNKISVSYLCLSLIMLGGSLQSKAQQQGVKPLNFIKKQIASESFESVDIFDVNNDNTSDIVSGWRKASCCAMVLPIEQPTTLIFFMSSASNKPA